MVPKVPTVREVLGFVINILLMIKSPQTFVTSGTLGTSGTFVPLLPSVS